MLVSVLAAGICDGARLSVGACFQSVWGAEPSMSDQANKPEANCEMDEKRRWDIIVGGLRMKYPNGHPLFLDLVLEELELHGNKNHDYAKGGNPIGNFYRLADIMKLYPGFPIDTPEGSAVIQMLKQLDAAMWIMAKRIETKVEGLDARFKDVGIFTKLVRCILRDKSTKKDR